jgi:D-hydroxyproline dehydrogenase subunit gamma
MFSRLPEVADAATISVTIDGTSAGNSVAATLLAAGFDRCRTSPVSGAPRGPYCLMGRALSA